MARIPGEDDRMIPNVELHGENIRGLKRSCVAGFLTGDLLDVLPLEILIKILSSLRNYDLVRVGQACKALNMASNCVIESFTQLDLKNLGAKLDDLTFSKLCKKLGPNLKRLDLDCWHLTEDSLKTLPNGLEELALSGCDLHMNKILNHVIDCTRGSLRRFAWSGFGCTAPTSAFPELLISSPNLTSFRIDSCSASVDVNHVVCTMADFCPLVNDLSAFDLTMETLNYMNDRGIQLKKLRHKKRLNPSFGITDASLGFITSMCPFLEELILVDKSRIMLLQEQDVLTDTGLLVLAAVAPTLRKLKFKIATPGVASFCSEVAVMELASLCVNLTHIDLTSFKQLRDAPAIELIQRCPGLLEVGFGHTSITDVTLELLASHCKRIRTVSVKGCRGVTATGWKSLGQSGTLEALNLAQVGPGVWETGLPSICSGNPNLKSLALSFTRLTDEAFSSISQCHQLQELSIHETDRISNVGLFLIPRGCPRLRYVCFTFCEKIGDAGIIALTEGCPHLMKVRLDGCKRLSNPSVRALCQRAKNLRQLSMNSCPRLSDDAFQHLLDGASLRLVELGSPKFSDERIMSFHLQRPFIELLIDGIRVGD